MKTESNKSNLLAAGMLAYAALGGFLSYNAGRTFRDDTSFRHATHIYDMRQITSYVSNAADEIGYRPTSGRVISSDGVTTIPEVILVHCPNPVLMRLSLEDATELMQTSGKYITQVPRLAKVVEDSSHESQKTCDDNTFVSYETELREVIDDMNQEKEPLEIEVEAYSIKEVASGGGTIAAVFAAWVYATELVMTRRKSAT